MIQQTSLIAYFSLKNLSKREKQVYDVIKMGCPITNNEISKYINLPINCITGRTNSLVKKGKVIECFKRLDWFTGRLSIAWKTTHF